MSWSAFFSSLMINHVLQGLILMALVAIVLHFITRASAARRHSAWLLVLILLLLMPVLVLLPSASEPERVIGVVSVESGEIDKLTAPAAEIQTPTISPVVAKQAKPGKPLPWAEIALGLWLSIALWQAWQLRRAVRHSKNLRRSAWNVDEVTITQAERLREELGIQTNIAVCWSAEISSPQAHGVWNPMILLPHRWSRGVEATVLNHALAHEMAHIKRRDPLVVWLQYVARILFGFNPAVWYAIHQMNRERESACDDWALRLGDAPRSYANSLVTVAASLMPGHGPELAVSCLRSRNHLRRRISHMLDRKKDHSTRPMGMIVGAIAALAVTGIAVAAPSWPALQPILGTYAPDSSASGGRTSWSDREPRQSDELLYASWRGDVNQAADYLAAGADPEQVYDRDPRTPLIAAGRRGHWDVVELLLASGADVNHYASGDESVLMTAARRGDAEAVDFLIMAGADVNDVIRGDGTPMIAAARSGDVDTVKVLLNAGADPSRFVRGDESPIFHAVVGGHEDVVALLLDAGVDPSVEIRGDGTPLMLAIRHGHNDIARKLMDAGASVDSEVVGDGTALIEAARRGNVEQAETLILAGADVNQSVRGDGNPLIMAAMRGHYEMAELLLTAGANANARVRGDDTALINAVRSNDLDVVRLLLERGADPNLKGDYDRRLGTDRTPLNQARNSSEVVDLLVQAGANS